MRYLILPYLLTLTSLTLLGQSNDTWTSFWNEDSTLTGFKDKYGIVKIEARFKGLINANKFDDIIAVIEEKNETWESYYLTKTGRAIGRDSMYMFDNVTDCESEGFIRFRDRKTDMVGMFNKNGDIVVPAIYNDLSNVKNGMIIALKGAEKKQIGEHSGWSGGKEILIDINNKVLIDSFKYDNNLNFFSVLVSRRPDADKIRKNFKASNGQYYSFVDFSKEFYSWLNASLLNNFRKNKLLACSNDEIFFWKEPKGWVSESKSSFLHRNFETIKAKLLKLNTKGCDYNVFDEGLNPYIFVSDKYKTYFNNCGESKDWIYPIKNIVINYKDKNDLLQDHFEFLRTDKGYKLISITIRKGKLK